MNNLFFLHMPKTGGSYVRTWLKANNLETNIGRSNERWEHTYFSKCFEKYMLDENNKPIFFQPKHISKEELKNIKTFTVVRNPYSLLASAYFYKGGDPTNVGWGLVNKFNNINSFDEFIERYHSGKLYWAEPLKKFLYFQIFDEDGTCKVDYILFQENLDNNLIELAKDIGINNPKLGTNPYAEKNYDKFYKDDTIKMVEAKCKLELNLFDYGFMRGNENRNIIKDTKFIKINFKEIFSEANQNGD